MQRLFNYIANEWVYWFVAIVASIGFLIVSAPSSFAKPVLKDHAGEVQFYQDWDRNTWYMLYHGNVTDMEESYDAIKVIWQGKYQGSPLVLIAGQEGRMCEMSFRLFWYLPSGEVKQAKDFGTCYAKNVTVEISDGYVVITFDGKSKRVPLQ